MSGNGNQVPLAPSQRGPGQYPRATTPHNVYVPGPECFHPAGASGAGYMGGAGGGAQPPAAAPLRVPPTAQPPPVTPTPQQDLTKTTMAGHSYVAPQNQTAQTRQQQQYSNMYRAAQHPTRPNTHTRQQQPYIAGAPPTATGPVMYPVVFQPTIYNQQSFPQTRATGYFNPYMAAPYMNYNPQTGHTASYYYSPNGQQLPASSLQTTTPGNRSNSTTLGTPATPAPPTATLSHPPAQTYIHPSMPGIRTMAPKKSYRLQIIDPETQQDILETYQNDSQIVNTDSKERQTPQPDAHSVAEEFSRKVNEVVNQPTVTESAAKSNFVSKSTELPLTIPQSTVQSQTNAIINPCSNVIVKSDILTVNESKNVGLDILEPSEPPVVSAISDSPVIVPKIPMNNKQIAKSESPVQSHVVDTNKTASKLQKQSKSKPLVPQTEEVKPLETPTTPVTSDPQSVPVTSASAAASPPPPVAAQAPIAPVAPLAPQPQRTRQNSRVKSEEKQIVEQKISHEKEIPSIPSKPNGPVIGADDLLDNNTSTSQRSQVTNETIDKHLTNSESEPLPESKIEPSSISEQPIVPVTQPSATERLSASIEKLAKEQIKVNESSLDNQEATATIEAQAKLTHSIASCTRQTQSQNKMKDINLNNKNTDSDTANGNTTEVTETVKEDINKNEKTVKNMKNTNKKSANKMVDNNTGTTDESTENGKDEADNTTEVDEVNLETPTKEDDDSKTNTEKPVVPSTPIFVPKYRYSEEQWSPLNTTGKKIYDINLLKQIKDDPLSKNKPSDSIKLEACHVIRSAPIPDSVVITSLPMRNSNDTFMPPFMKQNVSSQRSNVPAKKEGRPMVSGKGSLKMPLQGGGSSSHKQIIHVSLQREEVKLNESENAWKPNISKKENLDEEAKTQELYKKFRGILNKLTPQKFDTLLERVKNLEINNQKRLEGVIDLVFEKAIDEPNFSEAYAAMCSKLSTKKVPSDNSPDQCVNFRALIISKCQNQFVTNKVDEQVLKLEKELSECTDPVKKKELHVLLEEENRRVRMRSVGNVRFIGELYKLKMLTHKIMVYCMNYLIEKLEEEKLECLCKLLTTIGEQVEGEAKDQVDAVFKKMQDIVDRQRNKISSRIRFMIQDVIALRRRRWVTKSVVDSQPKMMDQIQKEAEQQHRQIEIMNSSSPMGGFRQDSGRSGKRGGDGRRQNNNAFMDNNWKTPRVSYVVDASKLKAASQSQNSKNLRLAPQISLWSQGSGTKNTAQAPSNSMISLSKNMYSALDPDPSSPQIKVSNKENTSYSKGASIGSSFPSRSEIGGSGNRSGAPGVGRVSGGSRSTSMAPVTPPPVVDVPIVPQEPLPEDKKKFVKAMIELCLINPNDDEMVAEVKDRFSSSHHAGLVTEILNIALEKSSEKIAMIAKSMMYLVSTNTISIDNYVSGLSEIFEFAPDLYIDIPMLYDVLSKFVTPQIEKKLITFKQVFGLCGNIILSHHGHLLLKAIIRDLRDSMGPSFVKSKWQDSGLQLNEWMDEDQVPKWIEDNHFEFLEGGTTKTEETKKILTPAEAQKKLLQLMSSDENCDCIKGWVKDNLGKSSNEDWFMRSLIQSICEYALSGSENAHFSQERMNKYSSLINDFGENREAREASCLFGIQQLIHRLEHPQGLTLEIFQYLHEQYLISVNGFIAWEESELEPEGKGVMMKALTSFFTNIKEAENEDSGSED